MQRSSEAARAAAPGDVRSTAKSARDARTKPSDREGATDAPNDFALEAGAEIGRNRWRHRPILSQKAVEGALAWSRAKEKAYEAAGDLAAGDCFLALGAFNESTVPAEELVESMAIDCRFVLAILMTPRGLGFEPSEEDVATRIHDIERRLRVVLRMMRLENDAALLALHAASHGRVPEAEATADERERMSRAPSEVGS